MRTWDEESEPTRRDARSRVLTRRDERPAAGEVVPGPDRAPRHYARRSTSPLRASLAEGRNDLPPFWVEKRYP